jgi:hypothetical protein
MTIYCGKTYIEKSQAPVNRTSFPVHFYLLLSPYPTCCNNNKFLKHSVGTKAQFTHMSVFTNVCDFMLNLLLLPTDDIGLLYMCEICKS